MLRHTITERRVRPFGRTLFVFPYLETFSAFFPIFTGILAEVSLSPPVSTNFGVPKTVLSAYNRCRCVFHDRPLKQKGEPIAGATLMEHILISENKLKIMLSPEDMRRFDLDPEELDGAAATSRRAFWNILDEARTETGFDPAGYKIFVQVFPSLDGGCELFVTRLGRKKEEKEKPEEKPLSLPHQKTAYAFDTLSDLLLACRALSCRKNPPYAEAYREESKRFYLLLDGDFPLLSEYGGIRMRPRFSFYIEEHGHCFAEDAVFRLSPFSSAPLP